VSEWFHAEGGQRVGPISAAEMASLFRDHRIGLDTLAWREGLPDWVALREVLGELGLAEAPVAEPAAVVPPPVSPTPATAVPPSHAPPSTIPMQPRKGLSGCAITAIIGGVLLLVLVPVVAILAAIALPAYNDYVVRADVTRSIDALQPLKAQVEAFTAAQDRCPTTADPGFPAHDAFIADGFSSVQLGRFENGHCGIEATFSAGKARVEGDLLWLEFEPGAGRWACSGATVDKYLPAQCRG